MLGGETDGAVRLQRRSRGQQRGVRRGSLGGADIAGGVGRPVGQRQCRSVDQWAGQLERDMHVGKLVFDGLVRTDDPAELGTLLGVVDRGVQQRLAGPDQLRGGGQRAELVGACDVGPPRLADGVGVEQVAAWVDGLMPLAYVRFADPSVRFGGQNQPGSIGIHRPRYLRPQHDGGDQVTGGQRSAPLVLGQQNRCYRNRFRDRAGYTPAPKPFQCDDQVDRVRFEAVEPLRYR